MKLHTYLPHQTNLERIQASSAKRAYVVRPADIDKKLGTVEYMYAHLVWCYVSRKPSGWNFKLEAIMKETGLKRGALKKACKQLADLGLAYLHRYRKKGPDGRIKSGSTWFFGLLETDAETLKENLQQSAKNASCKPNTNNQHSSKFAPCKNDASILEEPYKNTDFKGFLSYPSGNSTPCEIRSLTRINNKIKNNLLNTTSSNENDFLKSEIVFRIPASEGELNLSKNDVFQLSNKYPSVNIHSVLESIVGWFNEKRHIRFAQKSLLPWLEGRLRKHEENKTSQSSTYRQTQNIPLYEQLTDRSWAFA